MCNITVLAIVLRVALVILAFCICMLPTINMAVDIVYNGMLILVTAALQCINWCKCSHC